MEQDWIWGLVGGLMIGAAAGLYLLVNGRIMGASGILGGLALVTVLYILVTLALTGMVPYTELAKAENPSLATAFIAVGAPWAAQVISVGILVGLTTVIMVLLMGLTAAYPRLPGASRLSPKAEASHSVQAIVKSSPALPPHEASAAAAYARLPPRMSREGGSSSGRM